MPRNLIWLEPGQLNDILLNGSLLVSAMSQKDEISSDKMGGYENFTLCTS